MSKSKYDTNGRLVHAKVALAVPSGSDWKADMAISMMQMVAMSSRAPDDWDSLEISIHNSKGSILPKQRWHLVKAAQQLGATHILFIDSDMVFPPWILHKLLDRRKQVVACNCATKQFPSNPTARQKGKTVEGDLVFTTQEKVANDVLEKVWRVGTGIMLVELSVFQELTAPYFNAYYNEEQQEYVGEDWAFCELLEKAGIPIYIDHAASSQVGHVGTYAFSQVDVLASHDSKSTHLQNEDAIKLKEAS